MKKYLIPKPVLITLMFIWSSTSAFSFSTVEQYDQDNGYFSIDLGMENIKTGFDDSKVDGCAIIGKGLNSYISAYMGLRVQGNKFFSDGFGGLFLGSFATLYSYKNFSFDAIVEAGLINDLFYAKPGIELNFDLDRDRKNMGFYLNLNEELTGVDTSWEYDDTATLVNETTPKHVFAPETELNVGYYFSIIEGQQLHIRLDQRFRNKPLFDQKVYSIDNLKIGYNVMIADGFQIQTEFDYHIPQYKSKSKYGFRIGLVKW